MGEDPGFKLEEVFARFVWFELIGDELVVSRLTEGRARRFPSPLLNCVWIEVRLDK